MEPRGPFIIGNADDADLVVAPTLIWALGGMEPPEVSHFELWDSEGRRAQLVVAGYDVRVEQWEAPDPARLSACLLIFLGLSMDDVSTTTSLSTLIDLAQARQEAARPLARLRRWVRRRRHT